MKLEDIINEWEKDSKIDNTELAEESLRIPQLHSKYYKMFISERVQLKKWKNEYKQLYKVKFEYYNGTIDDEELKERGWEPFALKVLKADIGVYLDADDDLISAQNKVDIQEEKVNFLESAIKSLTARGYNLKSAIEWIKWTQGS
jgi:hypothetical protein